MLVFAIAVLVVKNVRRSVRLVAADAERQADVAEIFRDEIVEGFGPGNVGRLALDEFVGFGFHFGRGLAAVALQAGVPAADLLPGFEGGELNVRAVVVGTMLLFLLVFFFVLAVFAFQM